MTQIDDLPGCSCVLDVAILQEFLFFMSQKGRAILCHMCGTQHNDCPEHNVFFFSTSLCPAFN